MAFVRTILGCGGGPKTKERRVRPVEEEEVSIWYTPLADICSEYLCNRPLFYGWCRAVLDSWVDRRGCVVARMRRQGGIYSLWGEYLHLKVPGLGRRVYWALNVLCDRRVKCCRCRGIAGGLSTRWERKRKKKLKLASGELSEVGCWPS